MRPKERIKPKTEKPLFLFIKTKILSAKTEKPISKITKTENPNSPLLDDPNNGCKETIYDLINIENSLLWPLVAWTNTWSVIFVTKAT